MKAVKKQYVLIKVGKELYWAQVKNKSNGLYFIDLVMNYRDDRMSMQCLESEILAVSDFNVTVLQNDIEIGLK